MDRNKNTLQYEYYNSVALRKESVDRNIFAGKAPYMENASLSARRAWIEMPWFLSSVSDSLVALRKESVDRNIVSAFDVLAVSGRSPQGERG